MGTLTNGHHRWPPGLVTLRGYQRAWLRGDLIAGVRRPAGASESG